MTPRQFEILSRSLRPKLLRIAREIVGDDADAEDVVQDVLLKLWEIRDRLDQYRSVEALAVTVARRTALNVLRARRPDRHIGLDENTVADIAVASPEEELMDRQRAHSMDSILASLPSPQQTLIRLRHIEGYDNATIAAILGSSEGAVRTALSRARHKVAELFANL